MLKFSFDEWANEHGLKGLITQELRKEELATKEALSLVELKDLKVKFPTWCDKNHRERLQQNGI